MALYPNGRYLTRSPGRHFGAAPGLDVLARGRGDLMNRFVGEEYAPSASTPDGYGMKAYVPPRVAGSMSALRRILDVGEGTSNLLQGGPMEGSAALLTLTESGGLSLTVGLSGTSTVATITGDGMVLSLTIGLDGTGSISITGNSGLSLIVPFDGTGSVAQVTGTADLRGRLSMEGEWTPFTELSPENLAAAVWDSLAAINNEPGTMGELLNSAGAAADPLLGVVEGTLTLRDVQRIVLAVLAGQVTGAGSGTETFKGQAGENRVVSTVDNDGNRSNVTLDAT